MCSKNSHCSVSKLSDSYNIARSFTLFSLRSAYSYVIFITRDDVVSQEEGVRVCGIAVLGHFWCGVAVIFISKYGIAVFRVQAVCGKFKFYAAVVGEKIVVSR